VDANVLILDDVCTSGATMAEMVRTVRSARPRTVLGVVAAQA
jgi:predicted amidophosphoribosyltransferase